MRMIARALAYALAAGARSARDHYIEHVDYIDDDTWAVLAPTREGRIMHALYRRAHRERWAAVERTR